MASQDQFRAASGWLSSASAVGGLTNDVKLELYGLFKFVNSQCGPTGARPGIFSFEGRAKYDAWARVAREYADCPDDAQDRYVEIARSIGWTEGAEVEEAGEASQPKSSGGMGLGPTMSMMVQEEGEAALGPASAVHDAASSGALEDLKVALGKKTELVDARDEFGFTALHLAADRGQVEVVRYLLAQGADPCVLDPDEQTALDIARLSGRDDIVDILSS